MFLRGLVAFPLRKSPNLIKFVKPRHASTNAAKNPKKSNIFLKGVSLGAVVGVTYSLYSHYDINEKKNKPKPQREKRPEILTSLPNFTETKKVKNMGKESDLNIILFQYQSCPFCSKVRAFLNVKGISYSVVEVDGITRSALKWSDSKKVPTVLIKTKNGYMQLSDSSAIISILSTYMLDRNQNIEEIINYYPVLTYVDDDGKKRDEVLNKYFLMFNGTTNVSKEQIERERKWRKWSDEVLIHTICPNIYRTVDESCKTLNVFADAGDWKNVFGGFQSWLMINGGTYTMWLLGKVIKKKYKYADDVRKPLYAACSQWTKEVSKTSGPFMGGSTPDLSDLSVYGLLNCIEGSEAFKDVISNTNIKPWFYAMKEHIMTQNAITN